ncbi:MAG: hypothetical protein D6693_10225 [Planctomycetota bacterium]|nr:MAG: hypothetical protein D6693_10225 [Planctomycetota bacterium]
MSAAGRLVAAIGQNAGVSAVVGVGVIGGLGLVGLSVLPSEALSITASSAEVSSFLSDEHAETLAGLRGVFESAHALIDARPAAEGGSSDVLLWIDDEHDRGVVNEDELLILTRVPVLEAVVALTAPISGDAAPMPTRALFSDDLPARWRARPGTRRAVIATDVTAMQVDRLGAGGAEASVRVRLTFRLPAADHSPERTADAAFVVRLPAVSRRE